MCDVFSAESKLAVHLVQLIPSLYMPDKCKCVDFQVLKLQESPDAVPHG